MGFPSGLQYKADAICLMVRTLPSFSLMVIFSGVSEKVIYLLKLHHKISNPTKSKQIPEKLKLVL